MSYTKSTSMTTEVVCNNDRTCRFIPYRHWNSDKPAASIIVMNPSYAATVTLGFETDNTTEGPIINEHEAQALNSKGFKSKKGQ